MYTDSVSMMKTTLSAFAIQGLQEIAVTTVSQALTDLRPRTNIAIFKGDAQLKPRAMDFGNPKSGVDDWLSFSFC